MKVTLIKKVFFPGILLEELMKEDIKLAKIILFFKIRIKLT